MISECVELYILNRYHSLLTYSFRTELFPAYVATADILAGIRSRKYLRCTLRCAGKAGSVAGGQITDIEYSDAIILKSF